MPHAPLDRQFVEHVLNGVVAVCQAEAAQPKYVSHHPMKVVQFRYIVSVAHVPGSTWIFLLRLINYYTQLNLQYIQ